MHGQLEGNLLIVEQDGEGETVIQTILKNVNKLKVINTENNIMESTTKRAYTIPAFFWNME